MSRLYDYIKNVRDAFGSCMGSLYDDMCKNAKDAMVVPCSEVLTNEQVCYIRNVINPQKKQCYRNAALLSEHLGFEYVEGFMMFLGIPIEHAFNKVNGKYIDITAEFALHDDLSSLEYLSCAEFGSDEVVDVLCETGYYLNINSYLHTKRKKSQE